MKAVQPIVIDSKFGNDVHLAPFAEVFGSSLLDGAQVFRMARVKNSQMGRHTSLGDCSRLDDSVLHDYARIDRYNHLFHAILGEHSYTGPQTVIMHATIGRFTSISWGVTIGGAEHDCNRLTTHSFLYNNHDKLRPEGLPAYDRFASKCEVGSDVWIAANATINRDVTVGDGSVIGANAVVTKDVPPYAIVAGVPARIIRFRFPEEFIQRLLQIQWWNFPDEIIRRHFQLFKEYPTNETLAALETIVSQSNPAKNPQS